MAPPAPPVGSDLSPSVGNTNVRMMSEYVLIDIAGSSSNPSGEAQVTAQFFMQNLGTVTERMNVRFPMNHSYYDLDYELENREEFCNYSPYPSLQDLKVWVDGKNAATEISYQTMEDYWGPTDENGAVKSVRVPCWAHFEVTFPPNQEVEVKVAYTVSGYDFNGYGSGAVQFAYVLGTGAGWNGTIGKADIVARLPYEVNELNVLACYPDDCRLSGMEVSWYFEDFLPEGNLELQIVRTPVWQRVLLESANVQKNPRDGEAWGRLGKAYKEALVDGKGMILVYEPRTETIFDLSQEAYQKALELLPEDADWQYGYADLLCNRALWSEGTLEDWAACVTPLKQCLELNPAHERGNALLEQIAESQEWSWVDYKIVDTSGPEPVYLVLTPGANPTATETALSTHTPSPTAAASSTSSPSQTATQQPADTATPTPAPEDTATPQSTSTTAPTETPAAARTYTGSRVIVLALLGGCGLLLILVLGAILVFWRLMK